MEKFCRAILIFSFAVTAVVSLIVMLFGCFLIKNPGLVWRVLTYCLGSACILCGIVGVISLFIMIIECVRK